MQENVDQNKPKYKHFSRSGKWRECRMKEKIVNNYDCNLQQRVLLSYT